MLHTISAGRLTLISLTVICCRAEKAMGPTRVSVRYPVQLPTVGARVSGGGLSTCTCSPPAWGDHTGEETAADRWHDLKRGAKSWEGAVRRRGEDPASRDVLVAGSYSLRRLLNRAIGALSMSGRTRRGDAAARGRCARARGEMRAFLGVFRADSGVRNRPFCDVSACFCALLERFS